MDDRKPGSPHATANGVAKESKSGMTCQSRSYRAWTNIEETKLVKALVNMVNTGGFKADQGFKAGYLSHLEQVLKESLPNSRILGKPHIESKIKVLKRDWQSVHNMLNNSSTSAFTYDNINHCIIATDQVWESYIQVNKGAAKLRHKIFPHYEDLTIVFGKDKVEGNTTKHLIEMEEEVNTNEKSQMQDLGDDSDDVMASSRIPDSDTDVKSEETSSVRNNKRKARVDLMVKGFSAFTRLVDTMGKIANSIEKDMEREEVLDRKRSMLTCEISKIKSLSQLEKFKGIMKIGGKSRNVNVFWDLQEMDREAFVKWILEEGN